MQKALDQMNLQLHHVISDPQRPDRFGDCGGDPGWGARSTNTGEVTPQAHQGQRRNIAKSLVGDYRPEQLFSLRQSLAAYRSYQQLIGECDREIQRSLGELDSKGDAFPPTGSELAEAAGADFDLGRQLRRIWGVDLTEVPGLSTLTVRTLLGEIGPDFAKFPTVSAFASWLGLCPDNDITGGKVQRVSIRKVNSRAAKALRLAAQSLHQSKSASGAFYRRMRTRLGAPQAVTAAAHKLARIIYHLVTHQGSRSPSPWLSGTC